MYQLAIKIVQLAIFSLYIWIGFLSEAADDMPRNGVIIGAFLVVFVITVLPVIIYRRCEMLFWKIRHWLGKEESRIDTETLRIEPTLTKRRMPSPSNQHNERSTRWLR